MATRGGRLRADPWSSGTWGRRQEWGVYLGLVKVVADDGRTESCRNEAMHLARARMSFRGRLPYVARPADATTHTSLRRNAHARPDRDSPGRWTGRTGTRTIAASCGPTHTHTVALSHESLLGSRASSVASAKRQQRKEGASGAAEQASRSTSADSFGSDPAPARRARWVGIGHPLS